MAAAALPALPLRLAAEPPARSMFPSSVALGVHLHPTHTHGGNLELATIVDDDGIRAFATSSPISRRVLLELLDLPHTPEPAASAATSGSSSSRNWMEGPIVCLVRTSASSNDMEWHLYQKSEEFPTKVDASTLRSILATIPKCHDAFVAKLLTESIRIYYAQQVLEPSVRGFLTVLEKQFARSDLYLFELLQNAVDDGASDIQMMVVRSSGGNSSGGGLSFSHNGRAFTPLDVLGLSSVGLSTKSREGKRTIGFMGVGFKACYKRYNRVIINDGKYNFAYERPSQDKGYGWVMQPTWVQNSGIISTNDSGDANGGDGWCRFSLERPVGGVASVEKDLSVLPQTAPPLLGRAALEKRWEGGQQQESDTWTLNWNGKIHRIKRTNMSALAGGSGSRGGGSFHTATDRSEIVAVEITDRSGNTSATRWLFVSHKYTPSSQAANSYLNHTKRGHSGQEEVSGFLKLGGEGGFTPIYRASAMSGATLGGIVHSVLPTKLRMPVPMNIQGPWLLSVDRQDVQNLGDNLWNKDLVQRLPMLVVNAFRWAATERLSSVPQYRALGKLLPMLSLGTSSGGLSASALSTEILGQNVSLDVLARAFSSERILPVLVAIPAENGGEEGKSAVSTDYYEGKNSIWVPPSFVSHLSPGFLRGWLGKRPLRTDILGDAAYHSIFASGRVIGQLDAATIRSRKEQLARECSDADAVKKILSLMAALGAAYDEHPLLEPSTAEERGTKKRKIDANEASQTAPKAPPPALPEVSCWPVFLTNDGQLSTLDLVALPDEDFAGVPEQLRTKLRSHYVARAASTSVGGGGGEASFREQRGSKRDFRGRGKQNKRSGSRPPPPPQKKTLHPSLEDSLFDLSSLVGSGGDATRVQSFLARVRSEASPTNIVSVASAATNLLSSYASTSSSLSEDQIATVLEITEFAYQTSNAALLSYVMVGAPEEKTILINAQEAYVGKALDEGGRGEHLETFAGANCLRFLSSKYIAVGGDRKKVLSLFESAGVQSGLSAEVTALIDVEKSDRQLLQREILPKLPGQKLPQTRKSAVKATIHLPYDLNVLVDKRKFYLLDCQFSPEWEQIVRTMTTSCSVGFISLLLGMKFDASIETNPKTNHAISSFISGQGGDDNNVNGNDATAMEGTNRGQKSARIYKNVAAPLRRRLAFLPPGQPGGKLVDMSPSELVKQLAKWKWLPCAMPSTQSDATLPSLTLLRPEECVLSPDPSRPEMPVVTLPRLLLKRLETSEVAKALVWGTKAPAPPVERLEELVREATAISKASNSATEYAAVASELVSVWTSIARAHLRDTGLGPREKEKLRAICSREDCRCIPIKISPTTADATPGTLGIVPINRCVLMEADGKSSTSDEILALTVESFVASGFMHDMHNVNSNPFFSSPEVSRAVIELSGIPTAARIPFVSLRKASNSFLRHVCDTEPIVHRSSPIRTAFSFALKQLMDMPSLMEKEKLKLFVKRGPGSGSKALPARWLPITGGPAQPVLDDDKSRARSSLLSPEMGIQLLGILNHTENEDDPRARILAAIDRSAVAYLKALRLSDKRFVVKTRASGSPKLVEGASTKLRLVLALLLAMNNENRPEISSSSNTGTARDFLDPSAAVNIPELVKYEGISRQFQAPGMDSAVSTKLYAVWGRAPKHISTKRCILASGDADDYAIELEQLVLNHSGVRLNPSLASSKEYRATLRLLSHLESNTSFTKFVARDFADNEVVERLKKLISRDKAIEALRQAEKKRDAKALRSALMEAEEACDDDPDGGDAILQSARELLPHLEDEIRLRKEAEEKKKAAEEAEEAARLAAIQEEKEAFEIWKEEEKQKAIARTAGEDGGAEENPPTNVPPVAGGGRGRGLTLPSWMTSADSLKASTQATDGDDADTTNTTAPVVVAPAESQALEEAKSLVSSIMSEAVPEPPPAAPTGSVGAVGRGRGVINAPAWMAEQDAGTGSTSEPSPQTTESAAAPQVPPNMIAAGRGRGHVSNLPAWMTNSSVPADPGAQVLASESSDDRFADANEMTGNRNPDDGEGDDTAQPEKKKVKIEVEQPQKFNFTLSVNIPPSTLPAFVASVRPRIEEDAKNQGGSAKLERVDD